MTDPAKALTIKRLDPQALIQQAVDKDAGVEILERLLALAKDVRAEQAREAWNQAMAQFQKECPKIIKSETAKIRSKRSGAEFGYKYAPLEAIMSVVGPPLIANGLTVSWRSRMEGGKVVANCRVTHELGHFEESGEVVIPVSDDEGGASAQQKAGIAMTYARRYSLGFILAICPEEDTDGDMGGEEKAAPAVIIPARKAEPRHRNGEVYDEEEPSNTWVGVIHTISKKHGETNGKSWTMCKLMSTEKEEFITFSASHAEVAEEAGFLPVRIEWEPGKKGGRVVKSIEPAP